jgi:SAM-dependent methyltransferase
LILDPISHNKKAWDWSVENGNRWTIPVNDEQIAKAKKGSPEILLTANIPVPLAWLGELKGKNVLGLASGGGQQGPLLAAAGANVTIVDLSPNQLQQDRKTCEHYKLEINLIESSADKLEKIETQSIDLIINPVSNCFFPDLEAVWQECSRVLKPGGEIQWGFLNPVSYCFDFEKANKGEYLLKYNLPYSDIESLDEEEKKKFLCTESPLEYGHTLEQQISVLLSKGFVLLDMYEDYWENDPIEKRIQHFPCFLCCRAQKKPLI